MPDYTDEQRRLFAAQAAIAELMKRIMEERDALTRSRYNQGTGQWEGPLITALQSALKNNARMQNRPRRVYSAPAYNPFGQAPMQPRG